MHNENSMHTTWHAMVGCYPFHGYEPPVGPRGVLWGWYLDFWMAYLWFSRHCSPDYPLWLGWLGRVYPGPAIFFWKVALAQCKGLCCSIHLYTRRFGSATPYRNPFRQTTSRYWGNMFRNQLQPKQSILQSVNLKYIFKENVFQWTGRHCISSFGKTQFKKYTLQVPRLKHKIFSNSGLLRQL